MAAKIGLIACLIVIVYQDLRYRAVYWIVFPLLLILMLMELVSEMAFTEILFTRVWGVGFLSLQIIMISLYFSVKNKGWVNITNGFLGWGDILFLMAVAVYLSPVNYLIFYIVTLLIILSVTLLLTMKYPASKARIPLAGLQALLLVLVLLADWNAHTIDIMNDYWIETYIR